MTVPTNSWDETKPAGSRAINLGDDDIREMKTQVREVIAADHNMASSGQSATTGQHNKTTLLVNADDPTEQADAGILYTKDVSAKAELFYKDEDAHEIQITNAGAINPLLLALSGRFKIGNFTRDMDVASGNQSITGVGFQPSLVVFYMSGPDDGDHATIMFSVGFDDGVTANCQYAFGGFNYLGLATNRSIYYEGTTSGRAYYGHIGSMDSDGFTIAWTRAGGTGTANIMYIAIQ